jgi:predicted anti-sigma-YlaC factor YlaD
MRLMRASVTPCDRAREYISRALDGELVAVERKRLDAHLGSCADCRTFEADVKVLTHELRSAELEQPAYPVVLPRARRFSVRTFQVGAAAAAVLAIVAGGSLFQGLGRQTSSNQPIRLSQSALFKAGDDVAPNLHPTKVRQKRHVAV